MLSSNVIPLLYLCSIAGFVMVAGGVFLIYKEKIYIDKETNSVTSVETPMGTFKTNVPALALFILGFIPLVFPIYIVKSHSEKIGISGEITSNVFPVTVYAVYESETLQNDGSYTLKVPSQTDSGKYKLIFYSNNIFIEDKADFNDMNDGVIAIPKKIISNPKRQVVFRKEIQDTPPKFK